MYYLKNSAKVDKDTTVIAVLRGILPFKYLDGYASFCIFVSKYCLNIRELLNLDSEIINELDNFILSFIKYTDVYDFDFTEIGYAKQKNILNNAVNYDKISNIQLDYNIQNMDKCIVICDYDDITPDLESSDFKLGVLELLKKQLFSFNLSCECSNDSNIDLLKRKEKSEYGCHIEVRHSFYSLMQSFIYFLNSTSFRKGIFYDFDKYELDRKKDFVMLYLEKIEKRA